eukprot:NODE_27319_length_517_cov_4.479487.p2 GENE.NODE_27319_length_517_cov_4.479487~~NODE_27319_length_517_cov_4.479487.p2  ORF type:complete len:153 (+),score=38.56 NODE_27319_length_517_cov_4.479487:57-461(+)
MTADACKNVATRVCMAKADKNHDGRLSPAEFYSLYNNVLDNPVAQADFFGEAVFAVFDPNADGVVDKVEFEAFLDLYYKEGSIFAGDSRLPSREKLREAVWERLDTNHDGMLSYQELRPLLKGHFRVDPGHESH